jgi:cytochrome c biogenesis protein CcmG, thiol:disulfide interchange protein DsbE
MPGRNNHVQPMKPRHLLFVVLTIVRLVSHDACARDRDPEEGQPAPRAEAKLLDGSTFSLAGQTGKVVILNFWATWCTPCRKEMPALEAYYEKHQAEGLAMLAISMDAPQDESKVRELMRAYSFPAAMMGDAGVKGYGRIWRVPLTFVIDRRGILRKDAWHGDPIIDLEQLEKLVTPLLEAP